MTHCFISNIADLAKLNDPTHIDTMAKAVVKAVCDTILNPPIAPAAPHDHLKHALSMLRCIPDISNKIPNLNLTALNQRVPLVLNSNLEISLIAEAGYSLIGYGTNSLFFDIKNGQFEPSVQAEWNTFINKFADEYSVTPQNPILGTSPVLQAIVIKNSIKSTLESLAVAVGNGSLEISATVLTYPKQLQLDFTLRSKD